MIIFAFHINMDMDMKKIWKKYGKNMEKIWKQYGNNMDAILI